jgi:hypothetical protein
MIAVLHAPVPSVLFGSPKVTQTLAPSERNKTLIFTQTARIITSHRCRRATTQSLVRQLLVLLTLAFVVLVTPTPGYASTHEPRIDRVEIDETTNRMKIIGVNFSGSELTVTIEGNDLHIISCNPTEIQVYLPAGTTPGTYLLRVSIGNRNPKEDTFNVAVGAQGPRGEPGPQGAQGARGGTGPRGQQGDIGPVGPRGPQGNAGATGPQGNAGATGPQGLRGATGATGAIGATGATGATGAPGLRGANGTNGATGAPGAQGPIGNSGPAGPQGPVGADGLAGIPGAKGMNYKSLYDPAASYAVDDVVSHGGSSFIAKTINTGVEPTVGPNWGLVAQKGDIGPAGAGGAVGSAGPEGPPGPSLNSFDSLEGLTCRNGTGRTSIVYTADGEATLRCILTAPPPGTLSSLIINDVTQPETQSLLFTVALSAPSFQTVTVQFATEDVSAVAGVDYTTASGALTFLPGELTKTISVTSLADTASEPDETFKVNLTNAVNANIGDAQGVGTIMNAVPSSSISISNATCFELHPCQFTVTRTGDIITTVTVDYATGYGTADGSDFAPTTGTLTFLPGQTTLVIPVITFDDQVPPIVDLDEQFVMLLFNPSALAVILDGQGIGTIRD